MNIILKIILQRNCTECASMASSEAMEAEQVPSSADPDDY